MGTFTFSPVVAEFVAGGAILFLVCVLYFLSGRKNQDVEKEFWDESLPSPVGQSLYSLIATGPKTVEEIGFSIQTDFLGLPPLAPFKQLDRQELLAKIKIEMDELVREGLVERSDGREFVATNIINNGDLILPPPPFSQIYSRK